jgi:Tol biopolymer transport system component/DNA-binding winged helix-turn-helix (wHTH) protein
MKSRQPDLPAAASEMAPFAMGDWEIFPALHRLAQGTRTVQVEPRVMHLLACLAARPGEVVTREAFLETVWPGTVVVEKALTNAISELRQILADDPAEPRYIETIRKTGYRLIAEVRPLAAEAAPAAEGFPSGGGRPPAETGAAASARRRGAPRAAGGRRWLVPVAILAGALLATFWIGRTRTPSSLPQLAWGEPLTSEPGLELHPALSPDGNWIAYTAAEEGGDFDIYVKPCRSASALRLTDDEAPEGWPTWSPDGSTIAFVRMGPPASLCTVPAIGGPVRVLISAGKEILGISWSPDGEWIAYGGEPAPGEYLQVMRISVTTLETRRVNETSEDFLCAFDPRFSPDGETIAFARADVAGFHDLYLVPTAGGPAERLTRLRCRIWGLDWTRDGRSLVFAASPRSDYGLWRVSLDNGELHWLPTRSDRGMNPTLARHADRLAYEQRVYGSDIYRVLLPAPDGAPADGGPRGETAPLIASTRTDLMGCYAPDGEAIAFVSTRSGERQIWLADADGEGLRQMTDFGAVYLSAPCWRPDGRCIGFSATAPDDHATLYLLDRESASLAALHRAPRHQILRGWSHDGAWLYYDRESRRGWELWRMPADGSSPGQRLARNCRMLAESAAGDWVYCREDSSRAILAVSLDEKRDVRTVVPGAIVSSWRALSICRERIYFLAADGAGASHLGCYDPATGESQVLAALPAQAVDFSLAPDCSAALFDLPSQSTSDLVLVSDFR